MAAREPWFSRRKTAGDLENKVFKSTGRCNYLNENGEDVRYKQPGFRWEIFSDIRRNSYSEWAQRMQAIFDEVYEKMTSVGRERSESPIPVLPTLRTPGISKSRSRLPAKLKSPVDVEILDENQSATVPSNTDKSNTEKVEGPVAHSEPVVVLDITNTSVRRSLRVKGKDTKELRFLERNEAKFFRENVEPAKANPPHQVQLEVVHEEEEEGESEVPTPQLTSARPTRSMRSRTAKTKAEPVKRATRASTRNAAKAATKQVQNFLVNEGGADTMSISPVAKNPTVNKKSNKTPKEVVTSESEADTGNSSPEVEKAALTDETSEKKKMSIDSFEKKKRESVMMKNISKCRVSLSKVKSPSTFSPSSRTSEGNVQQPKQCEQNEDPREEEKEKQPSSEVVQPLPLPSSSDLTPSEIDGEEENDDVAAPPPPKRSLSVKPKGRKGKGRGARKGAGRGRKAAATRKNTPVPIEEEEKEDNSEETAPVEAMEVDKSTHCDLPFSSVPSEDSLYESCSSQVDINSPVQHHSPPTNTPPSAATPPVCHETDDKGGSPNKGATVVKQPTSIISSPQSTASPLPSQHNRDSTSPLTWDTPPSQPPNQERARQPVDVVEGGTYVRKTNREQALADTQIKIVNSGTPLTNRGTPVSVLDATYRISPMSAPYLSGHTPKTILRLQEEHMARTKGKIISMEDLRNASPLFKKMTATKKTKGATQSTSIKKGPSAVLSPSKIPRLATSGVKRLRSVSLEKVSCQELRRSKETKTENHSSRLSNDQVIGGSPHTPKLDDAMESGSSGCSDNDSTPVPPTTEEEEEGSSQEEEEEEGGEDAMNSSSYVVLEELSLTPKLHPQEEGTCLDSQEKPATGSKSAGKGTKDFLRSFFEKKMIGKGELPKSAGKVSNQVSLIPARNSPRKIETRKARQEKLVEKIQKKREEEERRCEELKAKKQQEMMEKRKKREEKAKKVAEKQAALKKQELEKKKRLEGQQSKEEQVKKLNQKKAREQEERQRRLREKMQAAEIKRKEEEDAAKRRAQQMEEERRVMAEMASKRKEMEEEEKRQKRMERQKLEKERQLQWKAEVEKEQKRKQRELEEASERRQAEIANAIKKPPTNGGRAGKDRGSGNTAPKKGGDDPKRRLEELLVGAIKVKAPAPVVGSSVPVRQTGSSEDEATACPEAGGQSNRFIQQWYGLMNSSTKTTSAAAKTIKKTTTAPPPSVSATQAQPLKESNDTKNSSSSHDEQTSVSKDMTSALNSTFTKEDVDGETENHPPSSKADAVQGVPMAGSFTPTHNGHYHLMPGSSLATTLAVKAGQSAAGAPQSYAMTPAENDPLYSYENYDIGNLSSDDSTDDEECPKKTIPPWANPQALASYMFDQEAAMAANCIDINKIFPPEQLLKDIDLARIFRLKRKRFFVRSSSAHWNSPLQKKNRIE